MNNAQRKRFGLPPKPQVRFDDCCTKCGVDLDHEVLLELFAGVRFDPSKQPSMRYPCPSCDAVQLIHLQVSFTVSSTGKRKKRKK